MRGEEEADPADDNMGDCGNAAPDRAPDIPTRRGSGHFADWRSEVNPALPSTPRCSCPRHAPGENIPVSGSDATTAGGECLSGARVAASGPQETGLSGAGGGVCVELDSGLCGLVADTKPSLVDLMADIKPSLVDLMAAATEPQAVNTESGVRTETRRRESAEMADRGVEKGDSWKQRYCEDSDAQCNVSSLQSGQPPSGPFVVGSQTAVSTERYSGSVSESCSPSPGSLVRESSPTSPAGWDTKALFGRSVLEAFQWHSVGEPAFPDRHAPNRLTECPTPRQQKVRKDLTLPDKVRLIDTSETTGRSQRALAAEFHISVGAVNNILRRKREYKDAFENKGTPSSGGGKAWRCFRPLDGAPVSVLQRVMTRWVDAARTKLRPLAWPLLLDKARQFAATLRVAPPDLSAAWLHALLQSSDGARQAGGGEGSAMGMWRRMVPFLLQGYPPDSVFALTETTLYYTCLPDCCYVGGPACQSSSGHLGVLEDRLTVVLCCSMAGERLKPLVVSRHPCPPALRTVAQSDLPVLWRQHPSASITPDIFTAWLRNLETSMAQQRRHIALFMETSPSHLSTMLPQHVSLKFYLDDSAHLSQPFSHGVLRHFKAFYRRRLLQTALAHCSAAGESWPSDGGLQAVSGVTELDAVFWIQDAWRTISLDTIRSSFHRAAFPHPSPTPAPDTRPEPLPPDFLHLVREAGRVFRFVPMEPTLDSTVGKREPGVADDASGGSGCWVRSSGAGECGDSGGAALALREAVDCVSRLKRFSANNIGLLTSVFELEAMLLDSVAFPTHT
ncbi:hypothetical protein ACOMHN_003042 [Nucella lapillus]